jgi:DNA repair protein RAD16
MVDDQSESEYEASNSGSTTTVYSTSEDHDDSVKRLREMTSSSDFEDPLLVNIPTRQPRAGRGRKSKPKKANKVPLDELHEELRLNWDEMDRENRTAKEEYQRTVLGQPETIVNVKMLPFQVEGLMWLKRQEASRFNGGILADSMGMGKTLQTIALIASQPVYGPTLVICPVVALYQWRDEIAKYTPPDHLKIMLFYGNQRANDVDEICKYDIVLTTYAVVESCFRKERTGFTRKGGKVFEDSTVHKITWGRIILDEAHSIKDRSCSTARSVFALKGSKKWSLSGTPLQNRVGELYSLIRFLNVVPYSMYFCTKCPCKSTSWDFSDRSNCDHCGHKPMR